MKEKWFVYAKGTHSISAVRSAIGEGGDQEAPLTMVRNFGHRLEHLEVFEVSFSTAKSLDTSVRDGGELWKFRFFHQQINCQVPFEGRPTNNKSPKVEAMKRAIKAAQKKRGT